LLYYVGNKLSHLIPKRAFKSSSLSNQRRTTAGILPELALVQRVAST